MRMNNPVGMMDNGCRWFRDLPCVGLVLGMMACTGGETSERKAVGETGGETGVVDTASSTACNGHDALCGRTLSEVTFPGTHNSMSNADAGWIAPNQQHGITRQLDDGVRALMLDTYEWEGDLWLCHAACEIGSQLLVEGLGEIAVFLDAHPREVVQIIFQDAIAIDDTRRALEEAGLARRLYEWEGGDMPPLESLIDAETNLVVGLECLDCRVGGIW